MDTLSPASRHKVMSAVKSKNTKIEVALRKKLWHFGIRYRVNYKVCNCHPDIVLTKYKIAIFCDGEFWHGFEGSGEQVKTNTKFWEGKIRRNIERDLENTIILRDNGWSVVRFWEKDIEKSLDNCVNIVLAEISNRSQ